MAKTRFLGLTNRVLLIIAAALLALSYVSIFINPARFWLISIAGISFVPLAVLNIILLVWAIIRRSKAFIIPLIALLPALFFIGRFMRITIDRDDHTESTIKIMTWNVGRMAMADDIDSVKECTDSIFSIIERHDPDIVCIQEMRVQKGVRLSTYLQGRLDGYYCKYYMYSDSKGSFGNVTFSKMPVRNHGYIDFENSTNLAIFTDYQVGDKAIRIYNCHFESYNISFSGIMRSLVGGNDDDIVTTTGRKMKRSILRRPKQVDQVLDDIENCHVDAFVCGDFNDTPMSYTYYRLMRGRKDTFVKGGRGFAATYARLWPILRLDYILCPSTCGVVSHKTHRVRLSDHYPVISEIAL